AALIGGLWLTANLLRAPTGRAWVAIRDSEIAAQSMGVNRARYKTLAFAYSAALMGVAGALFAHKVGFLAPDIFSVLLSIQFLLMVVVGGLGSLHGALFGAACVALLPVLISEARDRVPAWAGPGVARAGRGVSVEVNAGEDLAPAGPTGAVKPTIFSRTSRVYGRTRGRLAFCGRDLLRVPAHDIAALGIARTVQPIELFEHASVSHDL